MQDILAQAQRIKLVIFDVDGVLTDGRLYYDDAGREFKAFHSRDGQGMKMLRHSGVEIAVITARHSLTVQHRMANLGIVHVYQGQQHKVAAYHDVITKLGVSALEVAYVGDDVVDLPVMMQVGLAIATSDAHPLVKQHAHWHTTQPGGQGAAREVCEFIMEARGTLAQQLSFYLGIAG